MCTSCNERELLRRAGLRATPGRTALLGALSRAARPLTAGEAMDLARDEGARLDKVTTYRNLHRFLQLGLAHAVPGPDGLERYCLASLDRHPAHAHFACRICSRLECLPLPVPATPAELALEDCDVVGRVEETHVLYRGVCTACRQQGEC